MDYTDKIFKFHCVLDCRSTLSGPGGSFRSYQAAESDMDPRSQYCSWLITIAKSYFVSLSFKELTIPSCDDTFLKIFDGSNDTAPLLGTYCSTNASTKIEILSSTNNLFIVSNSGSYARNPKSVFSFHAEYDAAMHLTGWCILSGGITSFFIRCLLMSPFHLTILPRNIILNGYFRVDVTS